MSETPDSNSEEMPPPRPENMTDAAEHAETVAMESFVEALDVTIRVNAPVPRSGASSQSRGWLPPSVEQLQQMLPQYDVTSFIARGGMGAVYKGSQKTLKRPVAIKVLPPEIEDGDLQFSERFKHEAQSMARLTHPNIVAVFDAGETPDGLLYFVMEFVEGTDVAQLIVSEGLLEPQRAIDITVAVCEALAFAHEEGIVHRDIKPSNIMIDKRGRVKVADFGLAKSVNVDATLLTGTNMAMGTPDFIAPEALIPGIKIDGRADLYAVGVMLYQMLTGKIPRGRFHLPSGVVPQIDSRFDAIVDKAMQTDRELRYSTAFEIKTDVEKVRSSSLSQLSQGGVTAKGNEADKSKSLRESPAPPKSNTLKLISAAATVIVLVAGALSAFKKPQADDSLKPVSTNSAPSATQLAQGPMQTTTALFTENGHPLNIPDMNVKGNDLRKKVVVPSAAIHIPGLPDLPPLTISHGAPGFVKEIKFKGPFLHRFSLLPDCKRLLVYQERTITLFDL